MEWLFNIVQLVQVLSALGVVGLVLLQHGKGADMGAAFGGGSSGSLFGATGSANFLSRSTSVLAVAFFVSTLGLAYFSTQSVEAPGSVMDGVAPAVVAPKSDVPSANTGDVPASGAKTDANSQIPDTNTPVSKQQSDIPK